MVSTLGRFSGVLGCVLLLLTLSPFAANAAVLSGPPDAGGYYAHCNISSDRAAGFDSRSGSESFNVACQVSARTGSYSQVILYRNMCTGPDLASCTGAQREGVNLTADENTARRVSRTVVASASSGGWPYPYLASISTLGCTYDTGNGSERSCLIENRFDDGRAVDMPLDHYAGGTDGDFTTIPPEGTCEVVRYAAGDGERRATIRAVISNAQADTTDSLSVVWEASGSPESITSGADVTHAYASSGPFALVVTASRQHGADAAVEEVCELPVDFSKSARPHDEFGGGAAGEDEPPGGVDESCSTFDIPCWLRKLFVPDMDALTATTDDLQAALVDHWPFGPIGWAGTEIEGFVESIHSGYTNNGSTVGEPVGGVFDGWGVVSSSTCGFEDANGDEHIRQVTFSASFIPHADWLGLDEFTIGTCELHTQMDWIRHLVAGGFILWGVTAIYRKAMALVSSRREAQGAPQ